MSSAGGQATPEESAALNIPRGVAVLLQTRVGYTAERPVRATVTTWPGDSHVLLYELQGMMTIERATRADLPEVLQVLNEAADWLRGRGLDQWPDGFGAERIGPMVDRREVWIARDGGRPVGTMTISGEADPDFWTAAGVASAPCTCPSWPSPGLRRATASALYYFGGPSTTPPGSAAIGSGLTPGAATTDCMPTTSGRAGITYGQ